MIFVNFKTYAEASGDRAIALSLILEEASNKTSVKIIPVVQAIDAERIISETSLDVWMQHVDPVTYGAHTGSTLPEQAAEVGARGVFLNHSEHRFDSWDELKAASSEAKTAGLQRLIFAGDIKEFERILDLSPDYAAYEPPELVGSETESVATAKPEIISEAWKLSEKSGIPLIVGAGIHTEQDVAISVKLGAEGVAVASGIVKAQDPMEEIIKLLKGFK